MGYGPSKQNRGAGNFGEQLVQFKLADAQRIAAAVSQVEGQRRGRKGSTLPRAAGGGGGGIQIATFYGSWPKGATKQVTLASDTTQIVTATNIFGYFRPYVDVRKCAIAQSEGTWYVINAECGQ
jgi:hypothetical protein